MGRERSSIDIRFRPKAAFTKNQVSIDIRIDSLNQPALEYPPNTRYPSSRRCQFSGRVCKPAKQKAHSAT